MEAFGLLNLIKSALALTEKQTTDVAEGKQTEQTPPPPTTKPDLEKRDEKKGEAFSAFVEKHEKFAKKFRK